MSAAVFIFVVFVLKVVLDLTLAARLRSRSQAAVAGEDRAAYDSMQGYRASTGTRRVETGVLVTEEYSGAAGGAKSMFDDGSVTPVSDSDSFSGSRYD